MYAQVEKPKENKSRAIADSVDQKKSNGKQDLEFVDNRTEALTQRKLKQAMDVNHVAYRPKTHLNNVVQRAVPGQAAFKPAPNTGRYRARGGENVMFSRAQHPRGRFAFGTHTRREVFKNFHHCIDVAGNVVAVMTAENRVANVAGVQLDHRFSWDNISGNMDAHNQQQADRNPGNCYTLWDAKMYYNDLTNLQPSLAANNAAAGNAGVLQGAPLNPVLAESMVVLHNQWMHLQQAIEVMSPTRDAVTQEFIANDLLRLSEEMDVLNGVLGI